MIENLKIFGLVAVVTGAALAGLAALGPRTASAREIRVFATGEVAARVRRCGCQGDVEASAPKVIQKPVSTCACKRAGVVVDPGFHDLGGFPERSVALAVLRNTGELLAVDAGD